jgi:hypothetical protein
MAREVFAKSVQHGATGTWQHQKPKKHAEHVPVRSQQTVLDRLARDLAFIDLGRIKLRIGLAPPVGEHAPRLLGIALLERRLNHGDRVAELAKPERKKSTNTSTASPASQLQERASSKTSAVPNTPTPTTSSQP